MLTKLNLYQLNCDKCSRFGQSFVAAPNEEDAVLPDGWERRVVDDKAIHLCAPCDGREWPEGVHFH